MIFSGERRIWVFAIAASLAIHWLIIVLFMPPTVLHVGPEPIMTVSLRTMPAHKDITPDAGKSQPIQKPVTQPKPKIQPQRQPKTMQRSDVKTVRPVQAQVPATLSDTGPAVAADIKAGPAGSEPASGPSAAVAGSGGGTGRPDAIADVDDLRVIKKIIPDYPAFSRKRKEEGTVRIIITIDNGRVIKADIEDSSGYERLDSSAVRAVMQWRFDTGGPGPIRARVQFTFKLTK
ncbi:MAG: energy transducer TonB [Synergistaceae bacterium]|nr:energy transducer TonB [Synergistaceae bacterium]